jgi:hypothetical protein
MRFSALTASAALMAMSNIAANEPTASPHPGKPDTDIKKDLGETPGQDGCAARDLNPEPAD